MLSKAGQLLSGNYMQAPSLFANDISDYAKRIIHQFTASGKRVATAESCTGGLIASALTEIPGSSKVFDRGFVAYSPDAKTDLLGVLPDLIAEKGIVSSDVVEAMAVGALEFSQADIAVATTGIAGPSSDGSGQPVGLVYIGLANKTGACFHYRCVYEGTRQQIRLQAVQEALRLLLMVGTDGD